MYNILVQCEGVDFKVTGIKFMIVFIRRKRRRMLLARVATIVPLSVFLGTGHSVPLFGIHYQTAVRLDSRGREASTGWVRGLLS